jgi:hypothetical protein
MIRPSIVVIVIQMSGTPAASVDGAAGLSATRDAMTPLRADVHL